MRTDRPPAGLEESHVLREEGTVRLLVHREWLEALPVDALLAGAPLAAWGRPVAHALRGRGDVHVLSTPRGEIVAKAYRRGGLLGGLFGRRYADPWRAAREAVLAEELRRRGIPTPPVVAARSTRLSVSAWSLELATLRVAGARDLLEALGDVANEAEATAALARGAGRLLRRLHDAGLRHRDLQVKNVLVRAAAGDHERFGIIDLDRCELGAPLVLAERLASLARFTRSLVKRGLLPGGRAPLPGPLPWRACRAFVDGYGSLANLGRAGLLAATAARVRRSLRTHRLLWR